MDTTYGSAYRLPATPQLSTSEDEYVPRANSVLSYAYKEESNPRFRTYMEDAHRILDSFMGDPNQGFFAVYDGHGGSGTVQHCKNRLHEELRKSVNETPEDVQGALKRCFARLDGQLSGADSSGATATVALVRKENHQRVLYVANVGDSKGVLLSNAGAEVLTYTHNGSDPEEIDRIVSGGGILIRGRVAGLLGVSRALGDNHLKTSGVISEPHVCRKVVPHEGVLVLASDGLWDVVGERDLAAYGVKGGRSSLEIADCLLKKALEKGSQDNICVMVVCF